MPNKYIAIVGNNTSEVAANDTSAGAGDAGKLVALNAAGKIDDTMLPTTDSSTFTASEAIGAGDLVNLWSNAGTINARKADATTSGKPCHGFAPAAIASGATGQVNFDGTITGLTGLTVGAEYFLDTTAGKITNTVPAGSGNIRQSVGVAKSVTELVFEAKDYIVRA